MFMHRRHAPLAAAALIALGAPSAFAAGNTSPTPPPAIANPVAADYRIGPGDVLNISVDQLAELSKTFEVDTGGRLLLPLVGQLPAAGRTPAELSDDIAAALKKKYMKDPRVLVSLKEAQGQRVTIDGAVNKPGVYPLAGPTTLLQAVSLGGGPDQHFANIHRVAIFRNVDGHRSQTFYDLAKVRSGKAQDPAVFGNDIVVVDTSGAKSFMQNFQGALGPLGVLLRPW
jgi:polysaccharide export outer membrane protein